MHVRGRELEHNVYLSVCVCARACGGKGDVYVHVYYCIPISKYRYNYQVTKLHTLQLQNISQYTRAGIKEAALPGYIAL